MRKRLILSLVVGFVLVSMLALTGCPKSDNDPDPLDVNGTWNFVILDDVNMTVTLTHTGVDVAGEILDSTYATEISGITSAPAGATDPRNITLNIAYSDSRSNVLTGTVSDNNNSMTGTYLDSQEGSNSWTATKQ